MIFLISFLATLLLSFFLTGILKNIGIKYGIVSKPRARDIHKKPIPRIGGVAIFVSFIVISILVFVLNRQSMSYNYGFLFHLDRHLFAIWLGGLIIASSMLIDDIKGLKVWQKFSFQFLAVFILIAGGIGINWLPNPFGNPLNLNSVYIPIVMIHGVVYHFSLLSDLLTLVWLVGMMNILNFVDGVDGLAGGVSFISLITIYILSIRLDQNPTAMIALILAGAVFGFLIWNFPPAKIFMGDSGSMFLGFMLGTLTLVSGGKLATVFLVLGFPIVDGLIVALSRIFRKENPFTTPDKTHLHHRFLKAGYSARQAVIFLYMISIAFAWVALRSTTLNKIIASVILVLLVFLLILLLKDIAAKRKTI